MRLSFVAIAATLVGCSSIIGADFDRGAAPAESPRNSNSTTEVDPDGTCSVGRRRCGQECALTDDPQYGCNQASCAPCVAPRGGVSICNDALTCAFVCEPGFERIGDRCVSWRVEIDRKDGLPNFSAVIGRNEHEVFVAAGSGFTQPEVYRSAGDGVWKKEWLNGVFGGRTVYNFSGARTGEIFLGTRSLPYATETAETTPLLRLDTSNQWSALDVGDPPSTSLSAIWAVSKSELYGFDDGGLRHMKNGHFASEETGVKNPIAVLASSDGAKAVVIATDGTIATSDGAGVWTVQPKTEVTWSFTGVWSSGLDDLWAYGPHGTIAHSTDLQNWTFVYSGVTEDITGMWGSGREHWAIGLHGTLLHADAENHFERVSGIAAELDFNAIWGTGPNDIYVVGRDSILWQGAVLHRN